MNEVTAPGTPAEPRWVQLSGARGGAGAPQVWTRLGLSQPPRTFGWDFPSGTRVCGCHNAPRFLLHQLPAPPQRGVPGVAPMATKLPPFAERLALGEHQPRAGRWGPAELPGQHCQTGQERPAQYSLLVTPGILQLAAAISSSPSFSTAWGPPVPQHPTMCPPAGVQTQPWV